MKKNKKIFFTILVMLLVSNNVEMENINNKSRKCKNNSLPTEINEKKYTKLGYGIDFSNNNFIGAGDAKIGNNVFDLDWIKTRLEKVEIADESQAYFMSGTGYTYESVEYALNYDICSELGLSSMYDGFDVSAAVQFNDSKRINFSNYLSKCFYSCVYSAIEYTAALPNVSNYELYRNHLDTGFIVDVSCWANGSLSSEDLFSRYGTHIITAGKYGTGYSVTYCAASNSYSFKANGTSKIETEAKAKFNYKGVPITLEENNNNYLNLGIDTTKYSYADDVTIKSIGGDTRYAFSTVSDLNSNIQKWLENKEGKETLVYPTSFIPLWKILPAKYNTSTNCSKLQKDYYNYMNNKKNESKNSLNNNEKFVSTIDLVTDKLYVQGSYGKKTINFDSDQLIYIDFNQKRRVNNKDTVILKDLVDLSLLKDAGYKKYKINVNFDVIETDDGDRTVGIFNSDASKKSNDALLSAIVTGGKGVVKTPMPYVATFDSKTNEISTLDKGILYVRFGSVGNNFNAYTLQNAKIEITFLK